MEPAVLSCRFPAGLLPAPGFKCTLCGEEVLLGADSRELGEQAHRLGLFGIEDALERKLIKTGNSLVVTLDRRLIANALGNIRPGGKLRVGRLGSRIVIEVA